jgi:hypothetical protein
MTRNGKIARLPSQTREQLNRRLEDGEPGKRLVQWLNELPQVKEMLERDFAGRPISEQNLSEWKQGGYQDWLRLEQDREFAWSLVEQAETLETVSDGIPLSDHMSAMAALALGRMIRSVTSGEMEPSQRREVLSLLEALALLRQGDHRAELLRMEQEIHAAHQQERERDEMITEMKRKRDEPLLLVLSALNRENLIQTITKNMPPEVKDQVLSLLYAPLREAADGNPVPPNPLHHETESNSIRPNQASLESASQ